MKNFGLLLSLVATVMLSQNIYAQGKGELKEGIVKSLTVNGNTLEILKGLKQEKPSFTIDNKGVLTPTKGFIIRYVKKFDKFIITQNTDEITVIPMDGTADLGNGITLRCYSDNNCPTCLPDYKGGMFYCKTAGCECNTEVVMPPQGCIPEYLHE